MEGGGDQLRVLRPVREEHHAQEVEEEDEDVQRLEVLDEQQVVNSKASASLPDA